MVYGVCHIDDSTYQYVVFWHFHFQNGLKQYCFLVFLVVCVMVAVYIFLIVPETKNKTFLEIHAEFQSRGKRRIMNKVDGTDGPGTTLLSTSL